MDVKEGSRKTSITADHPDDVREVASWEKKGVRVGVGGGGSGRPNPKDHPAIGEGSTTTTE